MVRARDGFDASGGTQFTRGGLDLVADRMDAARVLLSDRLGRSAARQLNQDAGLSSSEQRRDILMPQRSKRGGDRFSESLLARRTQSLESP